MEKKVPLFYKETPVGFVTVAEQGSRITLQAECSAVENKILRAYAYAEDNLEGKLLIGVMEPENGIMYARRTYTRNDLLMADVAAEKICAGEICDTGDSPQGLEWRVCSSPESLFSDRALSSSLVKSSGILVKGGSAPGCMAAPLNDCEAFALAPAFCLVRVTEICGKAYGIIGIDGDGCPITLEPEP